MRFNFYKTVYYLILTEFSKLFISWLIANLEFLRNFLCNNLTQYIIISDSSSFILFTLFLKITSKILFNNGSCISKLYLFSSWFDTTTIGIFFNFWPFLYFMSNMISSQENNFKYCSLKFLLYWNSSNTAISLSIKFWNLKLLLNDKNPILFSP